VLDDAPVTALNSEQLAAVLAPKTVGAWHLHELTRDADLADFVLFSSVAGFIGAAGQAAYAAANASLDALARLRHEQGRPARSIAWGLWAETSMMTGAMRDQDRERMRRVGILPLSTAAGLAAFDDARDRDDAVLVVARLESAAGEAPPVLRGLIGAPVVRRTESTPAVLPERLRAMSSVEQQDFLIELVREQAAAVLGRGSPETVGSAQSFQSLGFDSLTSVELRNRLNRSVGLRLPTSSVFDFPTPVRLAGRLQQLLVPAAAPGPAEITSPGAPQAAELDVADDVDIDGMAAEDLIQLALGGPDVPNAESEPR
jgi:acyl carrier protein